MQLRLRFCQPRPQLALQTDHSVHVDHPPFTGRTEKDWGQGAGASSDVLAQGPGQRLEGKPGGQATLCQLSLLSTSRCCGHQGSQPELVAPRPLQHRLQPSEGQLLHPLPLPAPGGAQNTTSRPRSLPSLPLNPHLLHSAPCPHVSQGMVWLQMTSPPCTFADTPFGFLIGPERPCPAQSAHSLACLALPSWGASHVPPRGLPSSPSPASAGPTVDDDSSGGAAASGDDVLGHAGVVGRVGQAGLSHHQAVLPGDVHVGVQGRVHQVLIPEPLHLGKEPHLCTAPGESSPRGSAWGLGRQDLSLGVPSPLPGGCPPAGGRATRYPAPGTPPWPAAPARSSCANLEEQEHPPAGRLVPVAWPASPVPQEPRHVAEGGAKCLAAMGGSSSHQGRTQAF